MNIVHKLFTRFLYILLNFPVIFSDLCTFFPHPISKNIFSMPPIKGTKKRPEISERFFTKYL